MLGLSAIASIIMAQAAHPGRPMMAKDRTLRNSTAEVASLVAELEKAEAYEQMLRQLISDARDQLAAGNTSIALSLLNAALSDIDSATDVVTARSASSPTR
ncbi:MAG: hypothetical protein M3R31_11295 [Pseudomonadota bacterium]|nr:hypothetical protein [Pseudomonadota bacterium]